LLNTRHARWHLMGQEIGLRSLMKAIPG